MREESACEKRRKCCVREEGACEKRRVMMCEGGGCMRVGE